MYFMNMFKKRDLLYLTLVLIILKIPLGLLYAQDSFNATMTVEANIMGFAEESAKEVSIKVPDYIFLGDVTKENPVSDEVKIYINNTGKVPIRVTPQLKENIFSTFSRLIGKENSNDIFGNLFFRTTKTSNGTDVIPVKIGNYFLDIDKPSSGSSYKSKYFYMKLDLTDFSGEINQDLIGYKTEIIFLAMAQ